MTWPWIVLFVGLWIAVLVNLALVAGLNRRLDEVSANAGKANSGNGGLGPDNVSVGMPFPASPAFDESWNIPGKQDGTVVLFLGSGCAPCLHLGQLLNNPEDNSITAFEDVNIVVVSTEQGVEAFSGPGVDRVVVEQSREISDVIGVKVTPTGIAVDRHGQITAIKLPASVDDVVGLAESCKRLDEHEAVLATAS